MTKLMKFSTKIKFNNFKDETLTISSKERNEVYYAIAELVQQIVQKQRVYNG